MSELRFLSLTDESAYKIYQNSWHEAGEMKLTPMSSNLQNSYVEWYQSLSAESPTAPKNFVPRDTLFLFEKKQIVGSIQLRYVLNDSLKILGGHVGYGVAPIFRGQGYASEMLTKSFPIFRQRNIEKIMLTCDQENIASAKTIQKSGGILSETFLYENIWRERYWITL